MVTWKIARMWRPIFCLLCSCSYQKRKAWTVVRVSSAPQRKPLCAQGLEALYSGRRDSGNASFLSRVAFDRAHLTLFWLRKNWYFFVSFVLTTAFASIAVVVALLLEVLQAVLWMSGYFDGTDLKPISWTYLGSWLSVRCPANCHDLRKDHSRLKLAAETLLAQIVKCQNTSNFLNKCSW